MSNIPFQITDWQTITPTEHKGETGVALWRTIQYKGLRVRMVEYSPGYLADHWCPKGHILLVVEGEMVSELSDGSKQLMTAGMSYQVSDDLSSHRTYSEKGAKLFIIDGDFLKLTAE